MPFQNEIDTRLLEAAALSLGLSGTDESFDEFLEFGDSVELGEEGFENTTWNFEDTPPYDGGLYSTPLSWDPPKPRYEPAQEQTQPIYTSGTNTLSVAQQQKLRNIAMPNNMQYPNQYSPQSASSTRTYKSSSIPSPESQDKSRKRKSSASAEEDDEDEDEGIDGQGPPVKKTAHNMIEKRYRTNLNDKIAALRDSVPSLRAVRKGVKGVTETDPKEDLHGLTPAHKLNKATVLSKATEYIRHLEKRNARLSDENTAMKARISAFECLFMSGSMGFNPATPANSNSFVQESYQATQNGDEGAVGISPEGMIAVPDDIKRLHAANQFNQQAYPVPQENYRPPQGMVGAPNGWQNGGRFFGKMMVGSLAGLMILEGVSETEQDGTEPNGRGLFAIPAQLLTTLGTSLKRSTDIHLLGYHSSTGQTLALLRIILVFGALLYVFIPSIFDTKPKAAANRKSQVTALGVAPPLASPIQVRRQAWLTAIQTIWVPRHNFFLEAAALCLKMAKLSLRNSIGWYGYSLLTGLSEQQEAARVKAWSIALDAQLAGGDVAINKSRLILTLIASGTLPDTPALLMLKALHVRVLLLEYGKAGFNGVFLFREFADKLARWKWNEAKQLQQLLSHTTAASDGQTSEQLPSHLAALLEHDCEEVLNDVVAQRAYNLAFNLPTTHNATGSVDGLDDVVDDFAIRSPLDAAAAWYSSLVLQRALAANLNDEDAGTDRVLSDINVAIETAPIGSGAQTRALVARAIQFESQRGSDIASALKVLSSSQPGGNDPESGPTLINAPISIASLPDLRMSLSCAIAIAHLQKYPSPASPRGAYVIINSIRPTELTLLGFTAAYELMQALMRHDKAATECGRVLENLAGSLRIWIGGKKGGESDLSRGTRARIVESCLAVTKHCIGMEEDAGYETMT